MMYISFAFLIVGTALWAIDLFSTFKGVRHNVSTGWGGSGTAEEAQEFRQWNARNRWIARVGICLVIAGTAMQLFLTLQDHC